jgi:hypothetical protein
MEDGEWNMADELWTEEMEREKYEIAKRSQMGTKYLFV